MRSLIVFAVFASVFACSTPDSDQISKLEEMSPSGPNAPVEGPQGPLDPKSEAGKKALIDYIVKLSEPNAQFNEADEKRLNEIPKNPEPGSFAEAAVVVGVLNMVKTKAKTTTLLSLQGIFEERGVNLATALEKNLIIKNHKVYQLAWETLNISQSSSDFFNSVKTVIQTEAEKWAALLSNFPPSSSANTPQAIPEVAATPTYSVGELRKGDALLWEAELLAQQGQFKQAINRVATVSERDPFYDSARSKVKDFSNRAVQLLRQKAAQAFENSLPASDASSKAAYLEDARKYLEEAIKDYPEADQISTVKENLAIITKDLEKLQVQSTP
jgi:tetratricopeptide (TPR) repeat protein